VDPVDREYFEREIEPLLDHPLVEYVGEITDAEKNDFLGDAYALVCPYDWPEPFGIVLIEALACGTPVLAYRRGSIPEVIEDRQTGLISEDLSEMIRSVAEIERIDRRRCRESFESRFTVQRMVADYLKTYERLLEGRSLLPSAALPSALEPTVAVPEAATGL
jgi:glycosyltransferase involved in cell wall biosynthesis